MWWTGLGQAEASAIAALAAGREIPEVSDYVAFRLGQRDAFPSADPSLRAVLADLGLRAPAANWRPWLAAATASASSTSNSIDAWGTTRSAGHCGVPKHASAASESGHTPKCLLPGMFPLE